MTGTGTCRDLQWSLFGQGSSLEGDAVDAHEVGTQVREDEKVFCRVQDSLVDMRSNDGGILRIPIWKGEVVDLRERVVGSNPEGGDTWRTVLMNMLDFEF